MVALEMHFRRTIATGNLIPSGSRVLVALSGGADSVALLGLLQSVAKELRLTLYAAHLDHALRPESDVDADFVRDLCGRLAVPLTVARVEVAALATEHGCGVEETARNARRAFLIETAQHQGCAQIALGHHRGDQAETVLQRLLRGTGNTGLAAMRRQSGPFIRPLLDLSRQELRNYLQLRGLPFRDDPSNLDPAFTRNRIRHQLLPLLADFNPRIERTLGALAAQAAIDEDYWQEEVAARLPQLAHPSGDGLDLDLTLLSAMPPALRSRLLRGALEVVRGSLAGVSATHLAALERLLASPRPQAELHLPGLWAGRRYQRLRLQPCAPLTSDPWSVTIFGPGVYPTPEGVLTVSVASLSAGETALAAEFVAESVCWPLTLRTALPGDRFRPLGGVGAKKLKEFFIDLRIERDVRARVPLLAGSEILWLVGLRRAALGLPVESTGEVLRFAFEPAPQADKWLVHLRTLW